MIQRVKEMYRRFNAHYSKLSLAGKLVFFSAVFIAMNLVYSLAFQRDFNYQYVFMFVAMGSVIWLVQHFRLGYLASALLGVFLPFASILAMTIFSHEAIDWQFAMIIFFLCVMFAPLMVAVSEIWRHGTNKHEEKQ